MNPHLIPSPLLFIFIIFLIFVHVPVSLCDDDERYLNCSRTFECGNIGSIGYPFSGGDRPSYCGHPGFELECQDDIVEIKIVSEWYRVLEITPNSQTLQVVRDDFWSNTCPSSLANGTLNFAIFNYASTVHNLTLYYGCTIPQSPISGLSSQFTCNITNTILTAFYATIPIPINENLWRCNYSVIVPVLQTAATALETNAMSLVDAIDGGFGLQWTVSRTTCNLCTESGGRCGSNSSLGQFSCFCSDQPYNLTCGMTGSTSDSSPGNTKPKVSLLAGISGGVAGIIIALLLFIIYRRRRKQTIPETKSKNVSLLSTLPSENISSFTSSKTDLEKGSSYFGVPIFTNEELEEATDNYNPSKELGDGGFGTVYLGKLRDGRVVAVKRLYDNNFKRAEQFMNEIEILTRLRHQNLVTLYGCTSRRSRELLLVYEFIPNGTVADHLHGNRANAGSVTWPVRMSIAIETADALAYLHASDVIHRDVKTNNILLDNNFRVKVADFGLSRLFPTDVTHVSTAPQGTPGYVDPEYYQCYQITDKSDVYSFGVVLIELISSKQAVDVNRHRHEINLANMAISKIQNCALHELVDPCIGFESDYKVRRMTTLVAELAFRCLQQEREMRPSMDEVLEILRAIERDDYKVENAEVVDIPADDVGLLKSIPPPLSPDSMSDERVSSSTTPNISI